MKLTRLGLSIGMVLGCGQVAAAADQVSTWRPYEVTLTARRGYNNPYKDVSVSATFTGPHGARLVMPGFWDGKNVWRIRFAPPIAGKWQFRTTSSMPQDMGLQGKSGTFTATRYAGKLDIYRRGFLKVSADNRYLTYGDGTPFYWLGDTNWGGFSSAVPWDQPGGQSPFRTIVDARVTQGFSVWKAETFANNSEPENPAVNEGGGAWLNDRYFGQPNPAFWHEIDRRVRYVADSGLVLSIAQGIGRSLETRDMTEDHRRLALYILARYGAYPTVWITAQEYNLHSKDKTVCAECWADIARSVYEADPYKRPNSLHSWIDNPIKYHDQPWYGFVTLQEGHGASHSVEYWLKQYRADPPRPILEDEANYDHIIPLYAGASETMTRQSAWMSQIGGAFGFTYGAQGIWYGCVDKISPNPNCGAGKDGYTWREALQFPVGNTQLGFMRAFWTALPWWTLHPDEDEIIWTNAPRDTQRPFQKSNADHSIVVAYLPATDRGYTGALLAPDTARLEARWFDPRKGVYRPAEIRKASAGTWTISAKPTDEDWVLLVQRTDRAPAHGA